MQIVLPKNYQTNYYEVNIDEKTFSRGKSLYNNIKNELLKRFYESAKVFGFEFTDEINCWDFLSINSTPKKLKNLQDLIKNFKSEKVKITLEENNLVDLDDLNWLNELKVEEFKQEICQSENSVPSTTSTISDKDYFIINI